MFNYPLWWNTALKRGGEINDVARLFKMLVLSIRQVIQLFLKLLLIGVFEFFARRVQNNYRWHFDRMQSRPVFNSCQAFQIYCKAVDLFAAPASVVICTFQDVAVVNSGINSRFSFTMQRLFNSFHPITDSNVRKQFVEAACYLRLQMLSLSVVETGISGRF